MRVDTRNPFQSFILSEAEEESAVAVSPITIMYLQNKLAIYAAEMLKLGEVDEIDPDPAKQMQLTAKLVVARTRVQILQEVINEFADGASAAYDKQRQQAGQDSQT